MPARSQAVSSGTLRLARLEGEPIHVTVNLTGALDTLIKASSSTAQLLDERLVPSFYAGGDFRFKVENLELPPRQEAAVLESRTQVLLVFPPDQSFIAALKRAARDPRSFQEPWTVTLSSRPVMLSCARGPMGEALVSALVQADSEPARWKQTLAYLTRLRWEGRDITVVVAGRVFGQLGRVATALERERARGPLLAVSRGNVFGGSIQPELKGAKLLEALERLGLKYSAVTSGEIDHWDQLQRYRAARPDGVQFLSANLVYSSAPAVSLLPDSAIVPVGGLRVALLGLTPKRAAKYLGEAGLDNATVQDPLEALQARLPALRAKADVVVVLFDITRESADFPSEARGVDLVVGRDVGNTQVSALPSASVEQPARSEFELPIWVMHADALSLDVVEADVEARDGASGWKLRERHTLLDDAIEPAPGWSEFDPGAFGIRYSSDTPLLPSARALFPDAAGPQRTIQPRDFWSLAASLAAPRAGAELSILRAWGLGVTIADPVPESIVRVWLNDQEPAVLATVKGRDLRGLLAEADSQRRLEQERQPAPALPFTYGGVDDGKIDGAPIEDGANYQVLTTRVLVDALPIPTARPPVPLGRTVDELVLGALKERAGAPAPEVRRWLEGRPLETRGLWRVNFRDVGLNLRDTHIVRDDAFNAVPNSRIQGFDEVLIGGVLKTDADWLRDPLKWSNTIELEYARSRIHPRGQDPITNTTANRITFLTTGTRRAGTIPQKWLAQSWGPSLGFQFDSQFQPDPGLPRKQIYSVYPGLQFYDGTWIKSLELSANIKRDLSRIPPNTQPGLHGRLLLSHDIAAARTGAISLQGELYANYFFLTRSDTTQDLRVEGDANLKLRVPFRRYLSVSPFVDFYYFALKTQPLWGYSAMTGVQIGFSRLWKPQYEPLLGER